MVFTSKKRVDRISPPPPIRVKKSHQIKVMIRYYEYAMDDHQFVLIGLDTLVVGSVNGT